MVRDALDESNKKNEKLEEQVQQLTREIDDIKTAATISEVNKEDEIAGLQRRLQEEVASLHHIMKGRFSFHYIRPFLWEKKPSFYVLVAAATVEKVANKAPVLCKELCVYL